MLILALNYDPFNCLAGILYLLAESQSFIYNWSVLDNFARFKSARSSDYHLWLAVVNPVSEFHSSESTKNN